MNKENIIFKRKTDVVEKAIAWYQEALDTYNMMQITIKGIDTSNQTTWLALQKLYFLYSFSTVLSCYW